MNEEEKEGSVNINIQFFKDLDALYNRISIEKIVSKKPDEEVLKKCIESGTPVIYSYTPFIDFNIFKNIFKEIKHLMLNFNFDNLKVFEELEEYVFGSDDNLSYLLEKLLKSENDDGILEEKFNDPYLAAAVLAYCLKPFFKAYCCFINGEFNFNGWKKGYCPICGHDAALAFLYSKHEGKRYLWCPICEFEWSFKRICCPSCYEENPDSLGYFRIEEKDDGYRVNVCYTCKRYIKTYDEQKRQKREFNKFVEEKLTADLDYLAQKEGFTPTTEKN